MHSRDYANARANDYANANANDYGNDPPIFGKSHTNPPGSKMNFFFDFLIYVFWQYNYKKAIVT